MMRPILPLLAVVLACGACGSEEAPFCAKYSAATAADTALGAEVGGSPWLLSSAEPYQWPMIDTVQHVLVVGGLLGTRDGGSSLGIGVFGFTGPGIYPMDASSAPGTSSGNYYCEPNGIPYSSVASPGDKVTVSTYDSLTGEVSGTFSFHAQAGNPGGTVMVSNGTFHIVATKF